MSDTIHVPPQQPGTVEPPLVPELNGLPPVAVQTEPSVPEGMERAAPAEKPPTRRKWFVIGALLVVLVAAAVAVLLMVPSGPAVSSEEAESQLQDVVASALEGANTTTPIAAEDISVDCPADLPSEPGRLFTCDVEIATPTLGTESATVEAYIAKDDSVAYCSLVGTGWMLMSMGSEACL